MFFSMSRTQETRTVELLRSAGLRATTGRLALVAYLLTQEKPIGTPQLIKRFSPTHMDAATLYRTLETLEAAELVRTVPIDRTYTSYEWNADREHHHHLVCTSCKNVEDIPDCDLETIGKTLLASSKTFASITSHALEFFGLCKACTSKRQKRS